MAQHAALPRKWNLHPNNREIFAAPCQHSKAVLWLGTCYRAAPHTGRVLQGVSSREIPFQYDQLLTKYFKYRACEEPPTETPSILFRAIRSQPKAPLSRGSPVIQALPPASPSSTQLLQPFPTHRSPTDSQTRGAAPGKVFPSSQALPGPVLFTFTPFSPSLLSCLSSPSDPCN